MVDVVFFGFCGESLWVSMDHRFESLWVTDFRFCGCCCCGPFLQCWVGLPPVVLGLSVLSKRVETGLTATYFGLACAQTIPLFAKL